MVLGLRHDDEIDYPSPTQDAVSLLPYHVGGSVELATADPVTVVSVGDLRRFENMDAVATGVVAIVAVGTEAYVEVTSAEFEAWGVEAGDEVTNTSAATPFTQTVLRVTPTRLYVVDGTNWTVGDVLSADKRVSHRGGRPMAIRDLSLITDQACYVRFDGVASADHFDAELLAGQGYYTNRVRVIARITAVRASGVTATLRYTVWGV